MMVNKELIRGHWYHGDRNKYADFKGRYMDTEDYSRDRNAMGPGIYFTRLAWQASGYAEKTGYVYDATVDTTPERVMTRDHKIRGALLRKFINMAPRVDRKIGLENYNGMENAVRLIRDGSDGLHDALVGIYNDFYGQDSRAFAAAMTEMGFDAYLHRLPEVDHLIVWNPDVIRIVEVKPYSKYKNLRSYNDFDE